MKVIVSDYFCFSGGFGMMRDFEDNPSNLLRILSNLHDCKPSEHS